MLDQLLHPVRRSIAERVSSVFNDRAAGERPVARRADSLFGPGSVAWRVNGDVASMMVGGVSALLLQMLHPSVLAGVWDHSNFRADMHGRLRRTARFIAVTTFGGRDDAMDAIARVRTIHDKVRGELPDGTPYRANDPALLDWVNVSSASSFLAGYRRYADPRMPAPDQDRYYAEMAEVAAALGAGHPPRDRRAAAAMIADMRRGMKSDERSREVARLVLEQPAPTAAAEPVRRLTMAAGIDLLPDWARRLHGLTSPILNRPALRLGTLGVAQTLRWAFG
ncbi:oxygenase MpaB family protein [Sphingomonas bacterium]|uniref:oxygenase MpaB family protein n=1 Tax=Sphingomonas bacterium TaxID=1895847 RepID=UPI0020C61715|nr:oxygenase MpaB family protein [Sphingomonas bacterium]